jgi:hypothetical protein
VRLVRAFDVIGGGGDDDEGVGAGLDVKWGLSDMTKPDNVLIRSPADTHHQL